MNPSARHILLVAGEVSGDMHASLLVEELKKLDASLTFSGVGGPQMKKAGVELDEDLTKLAVVGFVEVLKHYSAIKKIFDSTLQTIRERRPAAVILVDYPGFNLRLARAIKKLKLDTKVIYYISPQIWAWKESRVNLIKQTVDLMLVLFEFEKELYRRHGFAVEFVGHPLMDKIKINSTKKEMLASVGFPEDRMTIGILPGSRQKEVENILGAMLDAATILYQGHMPLQFLLLKAPSIDQRQLYSFLRNRSLPIKVADHSYDYVNACDLCMVASGTATLETALLQKPMVVVYKTSFITWALARWLIKIPYIGLVNVVAGKKVVPECIQFEATGKRIAEELKAIYTNEIRIADMKAELKKVSESLDGPGASRRAAEQVLETISKPNFGSE